MVKKGQNSVYVNIEWPLRIYPGNRENPHPGFLEKGWNEIRRKDSGVISMGSNFKGFCQIRQCRIFLNLSLQFKIA